MPAQSNADESRVPPNEYDVLPGEPFGPPASLTSVSRKRDDAFVAFYTEHWPAIAGYCSGLVRSTNVGEELAQEAFTRLLTRWGRPADPLAYTYRIAHNLAFDHSRRVVREQQTQPADFFTPDDHGLLDAVQRLPPTLRDVTLLHYYADLTVARVADLLRRPEGTVKRQLHEARVLLAAALEEIP
jgi:RNA polymerase sigma-70 factor (ECF subfamily)